MNGIASGLARIAGSVRSRSSAALRILRSNRGRGRIGAARNAPGRSSRGRSSSSGSGGRR